MAYAKMGPHLGTRRYELYFNKSELVRGIKNSVVYGKYIIHENTRKFSLGKLLFMNMTTTNESIENHYL